MQIELQKTTMLTLAHPISVVVVVCCLLFVCTQTSMYVHLVSYLLWKRNNYYRIASKCVRSIKPI